MNNNKLRDKLGNPCFLLLFLQTCGVVFGSEDEQTGAFN
uniref:Uncharacterized protein n=1 Tax=Rhizophora mucronata TaxID=61149 RepID=A0A2P2PCV0_RHIMU